MAGKQKRPPPLMHPTLMHPTPHAPLLVDHWGRKALVKHLVTLPQLYKVCLITVFSSSLHCSLLYCHTLVVSTSVQVSKKYNTSWKSCVTFFWPTRPVFGKYDQFSANMTTVFLANTTTAFSANTTTVFFYSPQSNSAPHALTAILIKAKFSFFLSL